MARAKANERWRCKEVMIVQLWGFGWCVCVYCTQSITPNVYVQIQCKAINSLTAEYVGSYAEDVENRTLTRVVSTRQFSSLFKCNSAFVYQLIVTSHGRSFECVVVQDKTLCDAWSHLELDLFFLIYVVPAAQILEDTVIVTPQREPKRITTNSKLST